MPQVPIESWMPTAFTDVLRERRRQDELWGGPQHDDEHSANDWIAYIVAYAGQAAKGREWAFDRAEFRANMVKIAALAVAAIEAVDRAEVPA